MGFPESIVGKEFTCNAGDPGSIPGSGRSSGERLGNPFQYSWASLVAQLVKNLHTMWETCVWSLDWEDSPGEGKGSTPIFPEGEYPLQYSGLENSMDCISPWVCKESGTTKWLSFSHVNGLAGFPSIGSYSFPSHGSEAVLSVESQGCSESDRQFNKKERKGKACHAWNRTFRAVWRHSTLSWIRVFEHIFMSYDSWIGIFNLVVWDGLK